jgi:hypothetical protein
MCVLWCGCIRCYCVVVFVVSPFDLSSFVCIVENCIVDNGVRGQWMKMTFVDFEVKSLIRGIG